MGRCLERLLEKDGHSCHKMLEQIQLVFSKTLNFLHLHRLIKGILNHSSHSLFFLWFFVPSVVIIPANPVFDELLAALVSLLTIECI